MDSCLFNIFTVLVFAIFSPLQAHAANELHVQSFKPSSPFSSALETLQKQINYTFQSIGLLRRAMTHSSFSEENNRALSMLGTTLIETSVSLRALKKDIDISAKDLNRRISEISQVDSSCAIDAMQLGLQKVVRVSPKTNSTTPTVICGAFRAIFGAIAIDTGNSDDAGSVFWRIHHGEVGRDLALCSQASPETNPPRYRWVPRRGPLPRKSAASTKTRTRDHLLKRPDPLPLRSTFVGQFNGISMVGIQAQE